MGGTVLHAVDEGGNLEVVKYLVEQGADVNAKDEDGWTVLHAVDEGGNLEVVKYLVEQGADVNAKGEWGRTALHAVAEGGNLEVLKYLVEQGADVNAKGEWGRTALYSAARRGNLEVVKYLVEQGADVNAKTKDGETVLQTAEKNEYVEIVKVINDELKKIESKKRRENILYRIIYLSLSISTIVLLINQVDAGFVGALCDVTEIGSGLLSGSILLYLFYLYLLLIDGDSDNLEYRKVEKLGTLLLFFIPAFLMFFDIDSLYMKWLDKSDLILWYMGICFGEIAWVNAPKKFSSSLVGLITTYIKSRFYIVGVIFVVTVFNFLHWEHSWLMHIFSFVFGLVTLIIIVILSVAASILSLLYVIGELIVKAL